MSGPSHAHDKKTKPKHHHGHRPYKNRDQRRGGESGGSSSHSAQPVTYRVSCSFCHGPGEFTTPVASWICESCSNKTASDVPHGGNHQPSEYDSCFPPLLDEDGPGSYQWWDQPVDGNQQQLMSQPQASWATAGLATAPQGANLTFTAGGEDSEMIAFQQGSEHINADWMQTGTPQETHTATALAVDGSVMPIHTVRPEDASEFFFDVPDNLTFDDDEAFDDQAELRITLEFSPT